MKSTNLLRPDRYYNRAESIDFAELKKTGIRLLLIDVDNTLIMHGKKTFDDYASGIIKKARDAGIECLLFSNAKSKRIKVISRGSGVEHISRPMKPSGRGIRKLIRRRNDITSNEIAVVGDQLFTDIISGNLAGTMTILVDPISVDEPLQIKIKRQLEKQFKKRIAID